MKTRDMKKPLYIVQTNEKLESFRCLDKGLFSAVCIQDGLEGCYFIVSVDGTKLTVKADADLSSYLKNEWHADVSKFEEDVLDSIVSMLPEVELDTKPDTFYGALPPSEDGWEYDCILTDSLLSYLNDGFTQEK